jgi:hypothetical protein
MVGWYASTASLVRLETAAISALIRSRSAGVLACP